LHADGADSNGKAQFTQGRDVVLVIHGGAGVIEKTKMTKGEAAKHEAVIHEALQAGYARLKGGSSLDAVEAAIRVLEDSPLFNAGKGAAFPSDGINRLDASIMEGKEKRAGAVAGVSIIKNPIVAARKVMEKSEHVLLVGRGAEIFAADHGLEIVDPAYFWTEPRWQRLQEMRKKEKASTSRREPLDRYFGTVGAVAVDDAGNIAAGTSTGGLTNVKFGRVGDSPIIGAGTYADNNACGVSGTGHGEIFIRFSVAHDIAALVKYRQLAVHEAARTVLDGLPPEEGGVGGVIVLDRQRNCGMAFNTEGMYRGYVTRDGKRLVAIY
jgi:beta-aspartyl-peptidase (threonine type)